jgi:hypothetical protein
VRRLGGSIRTCRWGRRLLALPISNMYSILCIAFSAVNSPFTVVFAHKATNVGLTGHARRHSWPFCGETRGLSSAYLCEGRLSGWLAAGTDTSLKITCGKPWPRTE